MEAPMEGTKRNGFDGKLTIYLKEIMGKDITIS